MQNNYEYDTIIIGSGAAGLTIALQLSANHRIAILSKGSLTGGSSYGAQGGVAVVLNEIEDSCEQHIQDTLIAGAGLCNRDTVEHIIRNGKQSILQLIDRGVLFTKSNSKKDISNNKYHLTREGGHSARRIIHAADATGRAITDTLIGRIKSSPNIHIFEKHLAIDLLISKQCHKNRKQCIGLYVLNCETGKVHTFSGRSTVLATGGASKAYLYTSNRDGSTGDGIAMAWRAGCRIANMEFNQFHPTCLYHPQAKSFLISEAIRGEGGKLLRPDGSRFMQDYDRNAEMASRDIVARAIDHEMKKLGSDCLYLDISHKSSSFIQSHFPTIHKRCLSYGIDMSKEPIPVVPAAHYTCGGIVATYNGKTDIDNLFAIGECAYTGLHGANRLASNSLLECFVSAQSTSELINKQITSSYQESQPIPLWDESKVIDANENVVIAHNWDELRRFMWDYVGIVRTTKRLERAARRISLLQSEIHDFYGHFRISSDLIELRNLSLVSDLIIRCALQRKESRGLHFTID